MRFSKKKFFLREIEIGKFFNVFCDPDAFFGWWDKCRLKFTLCGSLGRTVHSYIMMRAILHREFKYDFFCKRYL